MARPASRPVPLALRARRRGFTLVELMVVVVIVGAALLLVPANLFSFGARSRLENAANTIVAAVAGAREQAVLDGHPVKLEFAVVKNEDGKVVHGHRFVFTNLPAERSALLLDEGRKDEPERRPAEQEWLETDWHLLPDGVTFAGVSQKEGQWENLREDQPYAVTFGSDGSVDAAFAIRVENDDMDVRKEFRTITVLVNPLTAEANALDGLVEMPPQRDENEFGK
jgi:prepilin-type N-terminal cleavage/methylation domain-containing protein